MTPINQPMYKIDTINFHKLRKICKHCMNLKSETEVKEHNNVIHIQMEYYCTHEYNPFFNEVHQYIQPCIQWRKNYGK